MGTLRDKRYESVYIVILNYNDAKDTIECIESLSVLDYPDFHIVIVDNASNLEDRTLLKTLEGKKKTTIIYNSENLGYAGGNNVGIRYAYDNGADYVCVANNDITVDPSFLTAMVETAQKCSNIGIVCPQIREYYNRNRISYGGGEISCFKGGVTICGINSYDEKVMNTPRTVTFGHGCCMLIRKNVLDKVGFLPEQYFLYYEDTDFSYKVINSNFSVFYNPKAIIYHKESASTKRGSPNYQYYFTRNRLLFIKSNLNIRCKLCAYPFTLMYILKKLVQHEFQLENVIAALHDFIFDISGKRKLD